MVRSVIVGYGRTPFGKFGGKLLQFTAPELGALAIKEVLSRSKVPVENINMVIMGHVLTAGCGQIPARQASINAGIPISVPVDQVNKVCASSLRAATMADQIIRAGDADIIVTGGMESMSNVPYGTVDMRWGHKMLDVKFEDLMVKDGLWCPQYNQHMAVHGGVIAKEYGITREMQDEWAVISQTRANKAVTHGHLKREIIPVQLKNGDWFDTDEAPRKDISREALRKLKPIFSKNNTVTPGNAPGCNDGASALVIVNEDKAKMADYNIEAVILGHAMYSEDSQNIATAPGNAINKLLNKMSMSVNDIDLFEINEAFAAVTLVSNKIVGCDMHKVNVNGGAIAFGHPLAATGARLIMTLISELQRRNLKYGVAALCSGMGQGDAILIENYKYKY